MIAITMYKLLEFLNTIPKEYMDQPLIFSEDWEGEDLYPYASTMSHEMYRETGFSEVLLLGPKEIHDLDKVYKPMKLGEAIKWWTYLMKECWLRAFVFYTEDRRGILDSRVTAYYIPKFEWNIGPAGVYVNLYRTNIDEQKLEFAKFMEEFKKQNNISQKT